MTDSLVDAVRDLIDAINRGDTDAAVAHYADDISNHGVVVGKRGMALVHNAIFSAFPDWHVELDDVIASDGRVVARGVLSGRFQAAVPETVAERLFGGALAGVAPTGQQVRFDAFHMWEFRGLLVCAHWAVRDDLTLWRQVREAPG